MVQNNLSKAETNLKDYLEKKFKVKLTEPQVRTAAFNLLGFARTLIKMKMELDKNEK